MPDKRLLKEGSTYFGSRVKGGAHHGRKVMAQVSEEAVHDAREARKQRVINVYVLNSLSAVFFNPTIAVGFACFTLQNNGKTKMESIRR